MRRLDRLDAAIIAILRINGRATTREIAWHLSVAEMTVPVRLKKMEDARVSAGGMRIGQKRRPLGRPFRLMFVALFSAAWQVQRRSPRDGHP
ncbi:MAG: hypothetical protein C0494_02410 [Sphingobium sp.]|nr:hypothetical protein [Sphingobium sp.]